MAVGFHDEDRKSGLKNRRNLSRFLVEMIHANLGKQKSIRLDYIFCSDDYLLNLNVDFLKHDTYTDIISFDLSEQEGAVQAEFYISVDRIKENAKLFEVNYEHELHRVIFHGVLHICGFLDKTEKDIKEMRFQEEKYLSAYFQ